MSKLLNVINGHSWKEKIWVRLRSMNYATARSVLILFDKPAPGRVWRWLANPRGDGEEAFYMIRSLELRDHLPIYHVL